MAISKTSHHARSASLPTTLHPVEASIEDQLRRLRSSQAGPSSSLSICKDLCDIKSLYEEVNGFIQLPHNQQGLSHEAEVVDGSIALLDMSSSVLDALSQLKGSVLDLESALRRGSNSEGTNAYIVSKKKIFKALSKCLVNLKKAEKCQALAQSESATVSMLKEAETICVSTLKSLVSYVMGKKSMSQGRGWSIVAKLVKSKQASPEAECNSEVEDVDRLLTGSDTKDLLNKLETLEMAIQDLEDGLESVSRCLVKTRVSLLNVLNH